AGIPDQERALGDRVNLLIRRAQWSLHQHSTFEARSITQCADRDVDAIPGAREGWQIRGDDDRGNTFTRNIFAIHFHAQAIEHALNTLVGEFRFRIACAIQSYNYAVAD